jgi:hypothetical protein
MRVRFKILTTLLEAVRNDLLRPHPFAAERVGFLSCRGASSSAGLVILVHSYHPVADLDYVDDRTVGAMMGPAAIRKALQLAYRDEVSIFHVHKHDHPGRTSFSSVDSRESAKFVPDFWNVQSELPHGAIVLSRDSAYGLCWHPGSPKPLPITEFTFVGQPIVKVGSV